MLTLARVPLDHPKGEGYRHHQDSRHVEEVPFIIEVPVAHVNQQGAGGAVSFSGARQKKKKTFRYRSIGRV